MNSILKVYGKIWRRYVEKSVSPSPISTSFLRDYRLF